MDCAAHVAYNSNMTRTELEGNLKQAVAVGTPVQLVDPATHEVFYLVTAEQFHVIETVLAGEIDPRIAYPVVNQLMEDDDLSDPLLESYQ
jgi:hypothetical protein